jgi:molecular chaperone GrpE
VFDNLERGVHSAQRAQDVKAVVDGLSMILRQFTEVLARVGIAKVPTTGKAFDPSVHEAIQQIETDEYPAGTVVAEVQPGYMQADRLVRAAMVVVAKPKTSHAPENPE